MSYNDDQMIVDSIRLRLSTSIAVLSQNLCSLDSELDIDKTFTSLTRCSRQILELRNLYMNLDDLRNDLKPDA